MATTVGTEKSFRELVTNLILLETEAIAAFEAAIDQLHDAKTKREATEHLQDHQRHLSELDDMASRLGVRPPRQGGPEPLLSNGSDELAGMTGDGPILGAIRANEDDTIAAYERAVRHHESSTHQTMFERALGDERRHRAWVDQAAAAL